MLMTHDLTCVLGELARAAANYPRGKLSTLPMLPRDLAVAAVAFTIQLAIEQEGRDPEQLRALERELIAKLEESDEGAQA
jgi:hypothetical protein